MRPAIDINNMIVHKGTNGSIKVLNIQITHRTAGLEMLSFADKSATESLGGGGPRSFVPAQGVDSVLVKPGAPVAMLGWVFSPNCLFIYGAAAVPATGAYTTPAWVYGAKVAEEGTLALPTGNAADIVKGELLCWPKGAFVEKMRAADELFNYDPLKSKQTVVRGAVTAVRQDGATEQAVWYYAASGKVKAPAAQRLAQNSLSGASAAYLKKEILALAAKTGRGINATQEQQAEMASLFTALEKLNPEPNSLASKYLSCQWELKYTTSESILGKGSRISSKPTKILQVIDTSTMRASNAEVTRFFGFANVPRKVEAELTAISPSEVAVQFKKFTIGPINVNAPSKFKGRLDVTYIDPDFRLSRGDKGNLFVLVKDSDSVKIPIDV
eukprot:g48336.t1